MAVKRRRDSNFFDKLQVSSTSFDVDVQWNFISTGIALMVEAESVEDVVQYSFDGETVHGDMTPGKPSEAIIFDNRHQNHIWFRRESAGAPVLVRVEAWRHDA